MTTGVIKREDLDVRLFFDVSVLEIFVNDRVAITTRVYPDSGKCFAVDAWVGRAESARMTRCSIWELRSSVNGQDKGGR